MTANNPSEDRMKPGMKALLVTVAALGFFLVPVVGVGLTGVGNWAVQRALGVDDDTALAQRNRALYVEGQPLHAARDCCESKCGLDWSHATAECSIGTQAAVGCYETCGSTPVDPSAVPSVLRYAPRH